MDKHCPESLVTSLPDPTQHSPFSPASSLLSLASLLLSLGLTSCPWASSPSVCGFPLPSPLLLFPHFTLTGPEHVIKVYIFECWLYLTK